MTTGRDEIQWGRRLAKEKLRRLYESDAKGLLDEDLLDDVGMTLYCRCQDILTVAEAKGGKVRCPRCQKRGQTTFMQRPHKRGDARDFVIACEKCNWQITWGEYTLTFKRKQMNLGGARAVLESYIAAYKAARTAKQKLIAVDRLIHEFHYYFNKPRRPVGPNLIQGQLTDILLFLDELTYGPQSTPELKQVRDEWKSRSQEIHEVMARRNA